MPGFDRIETAVRARDLIRKTAQGQITASVPKPLVGRMMTVDVRRRQGTVWFPGDDQPVQVALIDNAIPADWHYHVGNDLADQEDLSTAGYGATVVCQRLNGVLYVVQVLTGGILGADLNSLGFTLLKQRSFNIKLLGNAAVDEVAGAHESFFNFEVNASPVPRDDAVEIGPFISNDQFSPVCSFEMTVTIGNVAKYYSFIIDPKMELNAQPYLEVTSPDEVAGMWQKLLPERVNQGRERHNDFDLEVRLSKTENRSRDDIWFRVINRSISRTEINASFTLRTAGVQRARGKTGAELLYYKIVNQPDESYGALGFIRSGHSFTAALFEYDNYAFNTVSSGNWGTNSGFIFFAGSTSVFSTDGSSAKIAIAANNTFYAGALGGGAVSGFESDLYTRISVSAVALTQNLRAGILVSYDHTNDDRITSEFVFRTDGKVYLAIRRTISGSTTTITEVDSLLTYSAGTKINMHVRVDRDNWGSDKHIEIRAWYVDQPEPILPGATGTAAELPGIYDETGLYSFALTGNTNTKPVTTSFDFLKAVGDGSFDDEVIPGDSTDRVGVEWASGPFRSSGLRVANDLQKTWTHDAPLTWDGTYFKFTGKIHLTGIGTHRDGLSAGYAYLDLGKSAFSTGTYMIPIMPYNPDSENAYRDCEFGTGIPLYEGESLWVGVPPGAGIVNLMNRAFIVRSVMADTINNEPYIPYQLPEWAILIAARGVGDASDQLRLGNGEVMHSWHDVVFMNSWQNFGTTEWNRAAYRKEPGNIVRFKGLISNPGGTTVTGNIFTLPVGFRPPRNSLYSQASGNTFGTPGTTRIDISAATGVVSTPGHGVNGSSLYTSLDGITFQIDSV